MRQHTEDDLVALVRRIGIHLCARRELAAWRALYIELRYERTAGVMDAMMDAFCKAGYDEHDEFRFLWGDAWREYLNAVADDEPPAAGGPAPEPVVAIPVVPLNAI